MSARRGDTNFLDRHLTLFVTVGVLLIGQIASYAVLTARVGALEEISKDSIKRSEHVDLLRRTETLERELVPRSEHQLRDLELNKRLDEIKDSIKEVRDRVDVIDARQRSEKK